MAHIIRRPGWHLPESQATPESAYLNRRRFLKGMGAAGLGMAAVMSGGLAACANAADSASDPGEAATDEAILGEFDPLAAARIEAFDPGRSVTPARITARYNNAYEFTTNKERVWRLARDFTPKPWQVEVAGLCAKKGVFDYTDIVDMKALEERVYRFRCVEAWAITVPWLGVPFRRFVEWAQPDSRATHVRFVSVMRPEEMPGQKNEHWYPWPYYEGLRMDEAMNDLTMLTVGMYGRELPAQNGGPLRLVVPWKYGYKGPKFISRIEFTSSQPKTFWNDLQPAEYSFLSNVDPTVPHPRWSQASEELVGEGRRVPTLPYNGYGEYVAAMYR